MDSAIPMTQFCFFLFFPLWLVFLTKISASNVSTHFYCELCVWGEISCAHLQVAFSLYFSSPSTLTSQWNLPTRRKWASWAFMICFHDFQNFNESMNQMHSFQLAPYCSFIYYPHFYGGPCHAAHGVSVPQPGIEPVLPALEVWSLSHWNTREVSNILTFTSWPLLFQFPPAVFPNFPSLPSSLSNSDPTSFLKLCLIPVAHKVFYFFLLFIMLEKM